MKAKRFFCLLLSVLMLLSVAQVSVLADTEINLTQAESLEEISKSVDEIISASPIEIKVNSEGQINSDVYEIISEGIASSEKYLQEQITQLNENDGVKYGFEWYITTLLRGGKKLDQAILDKYYNSVAQEIKGWNADIKPTDVERTALAMAVMDKAITNIDGINLAELIYNSPKLSNGANELAYALLALDATKTEIPSNAVWNRDKIVKELLKFQNSNGGFGLYDNQSSDVDMTAICLQALAPYKNDNEINISINKAVEYLKANISSDFDYSDNSISTAQALLALSALKIDVTASENGFGNENKNIITALEKYKNQNGYGYLYENKANSMATVQIMQAYDAYRKAHKENILYWDFSSKGNTYDDVSDSENSGNENNEAKPATVYVTISSKGEIARDKNGGYVAQAPVTVKDKNNDGKLTVDEALFATHEEYYNGGATAGYSTFEGAYGVSLAILWGEGSENVTASAGYWLNNESCMSLNDEIKSGDYLTAFNYYDTVYFSDSYSYFTESTKTTDNNSEVTLTLNYISGYDENWLPVSSPCPNARVKLLNGENSLLENLTTDENGQLKIENKLNAGAYYLVAYKEDNSIVPAVCKLVVDESKDTKTATVYVTISSKGEIARDKNGGYVAQAPVTVKDKNNDGKLTVDEALFATHEEYYNGGATAGYSTFEGAYGVSLAILWGEGSENVTASAGYWLNNESCMSLNDEIKSGDYLTAFNYYDTVYFSDSYSYFTENTKTTDNNSEVTLTLNYISGYDENWLPVSSPCPNARVKLLNGENSLLENLTTDENGQLKIENKLNAGAYYLVAYKEDSSIVPAVCKLVVTKKNEGSSGGSGSGGSGSSSQITVYIKVADPKGKTYLSKAPYLVKRDITVYELLEKTGLKISTSENAYGVYVKSIEDLAEFDEGAESGWMFRVNGDFSSTSASLYSLSQGDYVEWLYTRNLGKDLGDNSYISSSDNSTTYMVKFETNGGNTIDSQSVAINEIATEPNAPKKDGFIFEGWYTDKELTEKYDFSTMVTGEITLYAKWLEGEVVAVDEEVAISFDDVDVKAWYAEAVSYVTSNSLFNGVSKTEFAPNSNMTRAMLVTVLYRLEKPAKSEYKHSFADVEDNAWYAEAVKWAVENGIVKGINEKEFAPMENVTREQMAAIIYRYAKMKEYNTENLADLSEFEDFEKINEYAVEAIKWANANKIINGTNENRIEPQAFATRAEVAVILMRFCENVVK